MQSTSGTPTLYVQSHHRQTNTMNTDAAVDEQNTFTCCLFVYFMS